jgi:hypothetical protein
MRYPLGHYSDDTKRRPRFDRSLHVTGSVKDNWETGCKARPCRDQSFDVF